MHLAAWVMLILIVVTVAFIALALIRVIINLTHVTNTLDRGYDVVADIPNLTRPVPGTISSVNTNLTPVRQRAESVPR